MTLRSVAERKEQVQVVRRYSKSFMMDGGVERSAREWARTDPEWGIPYDELVVSATPEAGKNRGECRGERLPTEGAENVATDASRSQQSF
jgi:hypothetical protein